MDFRNDPNNNILQSDQPESTGENNSGSSNPYGNDQNSNTQNNPYGSVQNDNTQNGNQNWQPNGYPYQPYRPYQPYQPEPKNRFAIVAMVLGLCSLLSLCTFFLPLPLGALGIVFVILSKRQGKKMSGTAITGLFTSLVGIGVSLVLIVVAITTAFTMLKPENRGALNQQFEQIYGMDFDEYMERIYGEDFDDMMDQLEDQLR